MPYYISPPPQNPLTRILAAIIAVFMLIGAFMIGMVALLVVAAIGVVAGLAIWIRVAWMKRQMRKNGINPDPFQTQTRASSEQVSGQVIEAEYTVISEKEEG